MRSLCGKRAIAPDKTASCSGICDVELRNIILNILNRTVPYRTVPYHTMLYSTMLCYAMLYYVILYFTINDVRGGAELARRFVF